MLAMFHGSALPAQILPLSGPVPQAAFQELLPEAAALVPGWQQQEDSWQGRQSAFLQLNAWRNMHGARLLFRDWDGDPSDPVNFPTAAAAAGRPSQLASYQVGLPAHMAQVLMLCCSARCRAIFFAGCWTRLLAGRLLGLPSAMPAAV